MKKLLVSIVSFALLLTLVMPIRANAEYLGTVTEVVQSAFNSDSIGVSWSPVQGATGYLVEIVEKGSGNYDKIPVGETTDTTFTINASNYPNLKSGSSYEVWVTPQDKANNGVGYGKYVEARTKVDNVRNFHQEKWWYFIQKVDVSWDNMTGVDGYDVTLYTYNGKKIESKTVTGSYSKNASFSVKNNMIYKIAVKGYQDYQGQRYYSNEAAITSFTQPRVKSAKKVNKRLKISWGKVKGATKYDVYVSTKKESGYKKVKSVKASKASVSIKKFRKKKIKNGKTYYVYVVTRRGGNSSGALYYWNTKNTNFGYLK